MDKKELMHAENILRSLQRCHYKDLDGVEVLGLANAYKWLADKVMEAKKPLEVKEVKEPIKQDVPVKGVQSGNIRKRK